MDQLSLPIDTVESVKHELDLLELCVDGVLHRSESPEAQTIVLQMERLKEKLSPLLREVESE